MNAGQDKSPRAPYGRKLTEARRIQNRDAQRKFRAKRKERLLLLKDVVTSSVGPHYELDEAVTPQASSSVLRNSKPTALESIMSSLHCIEKHASSVLIDFFIPRLKKALENNSDPETDKLLEFAVATKADLQSIVMNGLRKLRDKETSPTNDKITSPSLSTITLPQARNDMTDIVFDLPDPYSSSILLRPRSVVEIWIQNARILGFNPGTKVPKISPSPWLSDACSIILSSIWVPPDLYPTPGQLSFQHNACFDLLPLPWFRDRVSRFSALEPPAFDSHELKMDIVRGGMICWASCSDVEYESWDRRSWEVSSWFIEKWGWLIEYQGRVEQQSRMWRKLRES